MLPSLLNYLSNSITPSAGFVAKPNHYLSNGNYHIGRWSRYSAWPASFALSRLTTFARFSAINAAFAAIEASRAATLAAFSATSSS